MLAFSSDWAGKKVKEVLSCTFESNMSMIFCTSVCNFLLENCCCKVLVVATSHFLRLPLHHRSILPDLCEGLHLVRLVDHQDSSRRIVSLDVAQVTRRNQFLLDVALDGLEDWGTVLVDGMERVSCLAFLLGSLRLRFFLLVFFFRQRRAPISLLLHLDPRRGLPRNFSPKYFVILLLLVSLLLY